MSGDRILVVLTAATILGFGAATVAHAGSVTLTWTAPRDSVSGQAARYDLRYSATVLTADSFNQAATVLGLPDPALPGTVQSITINGLRSGTDYYFAIKSVDVAGNWSAISNVVRRTPVDAVNERLGVPLSFSAPAPNPARAAARFSFGLPQEMSVVVEVFDVTGRRVRVLDDARHSAGIDDLTFDLQDDRGVRLAEGLYLVRAKLGDSVFTRRLVVTR